MNRMLCLLLLYGVTAAAQDAPAPDDVGGQTRSLLALQREGSLATETLDELSPVAAANAEARMEASFNHPIPVHLIEDEFSEQD